MRRSSDFVCAKYVFIGFPFSGFHNFPVFVSFCEFSVRSALSVFFVFLVFSAFSVFSVFSVFVHSVGVLGKGDRRNVRVLGPMGQHHPLAVKLVEYRGQPEWGGVRGVKEA